MFEQMGATVSYDPGSKTVDVSKPGSDVKVTVGRPEVVINGETRPLDVPPEIYRGTVVVPVRVLSEGMGAYVQWVPDRRIVVVRYIAAPVPTPAPAPPPPAPAPTAPPTLPPTPAPTVPPATPKPQYFDHFIVGDYIFSPQVYNEFSPGNKHLGPSFSGRAAVEFPLASLAWMLEVDARQYAYPHSGDFDTVPGSRNAPCAPGSIFFANRGCVTTIGNEANLYVPSFTAIDRDIDGRIGIRIAKPRIYIVGSWLWHNTNYGYPQMNGPGFGIEKLPDLNQVVSLFGSFMHYPQIHGTYVDPTGRDFLLSYHVNKYQGGITISLPILRSLGAFIEGGWMGDYLWRKENAPADSHHQGPFAGFGIRF
jgi:hypothetical protein